MIIENTNQLVKYCLNKPRNERYEIIEDYLLCTNLNETDITFLTLAIINELSRIEGK